MFIKIVHDSNPKKSQNLYNKVALISQKYPLVPFY